MAWAGVDWSPHWSWIPAGNVRRVTDPAWDIEETGAVRGTRVASGGGRLPGFLPRSVQVLPLKRGEPAICLCKGLAPRASTLSPYSEGAC